MSTDLESAHQNLLVTATFIRVTGIKQLLRYLLLLFVFPYRAHRIIIEIIFPCFN